MQGWIKLHRKLKKWEWYKDINTKTAFIEILITANIKSCPFKGKIIPKGSLLTTYEELGKECGLTKDEARRAINNLKTAHTITTQKVLNQLQINIENFSVYQVSDVDKNCTNAIQTYTQDPHDSHTIPTPIEEEVKEREEGKKNKKKDNTPLPPAGGTDTKAKLRAVWDRFNFEPDLHRAVKDWIKYKTEKGQAYKPTGLNSFLVQVQKHAQKHGNKIIIELINDCMANNWAGVAWDRLDNAKNQNTAKSRAEEAKIKLGGLEL